MTKLSDWLNSSDRPHSGGIYNELKSGEIYNELESMTS